jgi:hypothetical protein
MRVAENAPMYTNYAEATISTEASIAPVSGSAQQWDRAGAQAGAGASKVIKFSDVKLVLTLFA